MTVPPPEEEWLEAWAMEHIIVEEQEEDLECHESIDWDSMEVDIEEAPTWQSFLEWAELEEEEWQEGVSYIFMEE